MAHLVLIPQDIAEEGKEYLRERGYEIRLGSGTTEQIMKEEVRGCSAILARTAVFSAVVLEAEKGLRVVARHGVGVDNIDIETATRLGIWITNAPESNANSVAEHTLGLIIACARNLVKCNRDFLSGDFEIRNRLIGCDLEGKILGVVGLGRIGSRVCRKAAMGFDMKVLGYDPLIGADGIPAGVERVNDLDDLLKRSDFVSLHLPSTPETKGMFSRREFELMKNTAYLINASRGEIVDEQQLVRALEEGLIAGAGIDVFEQEPPPKDHPLLGLDNATLTPHSAALTREAMIRMALHAAQGIDEVLSGKRPTWPVNDPTKGQRYD
jgi:D-3-phosphoglycerate dehydrogenase